LKDDSILNTGKDCAPENGKSFPAQGNVKSLRPGTGRFFGYVGI
jgi:hypothetical protein